MSFTDSNVLTVVLAFSFLGVAASGLIAGCGDGLHYEKNLKTGKETPRPRCDTT